MVKKSVVNWLMLVQWLEDVKIDTVWETNRRSIQYVQKGLFWNNLAYSFTSCNTQSKLTIHSPRLSNNLLQKTHNCSWVKHLNLNLFFYPLDKSLSLQLLRSPRVKSRYSLNFFLNADQRVFPSVWCIIYLQDMWARSLLLLLNS